MLNVNRSLARRLFVVETFFFVIFVKIIFFMKKGFVRRLAV